MSARGDEQLDMLAACDMANAARTVRLSAAQTEAAKARVAQFPSGWTYWTKGEDAPFYGTRAEAEAASIEEWRVNL